MAGILRRRGMDPSVMDSQEPEPAPQPVTSLALADARIPPRYRQALADHPEVAAWVDEIVRAGRPGPSGARGIAEGPSLLIAGPTGTGKTHQAYGAVRSLLAAGVRLRWETVTAADLRLINYRYEYLRPTLLTTNLPILKLRTALGDRVASRLSEMTHRVILNGPDRRRTSPAA
ncbi:ATP-binding protein [Streptomyces sp. NPDC059650]|uniref:ATP-binding protein n=1 Tax=Streptomyces sp. NPDC059650 TaxID=3346896 RepID=UPI0036ACD6B9